MTHVFCNQLINYLLTGYPVRAENTKPSVTPHGPHFVHSVLCDLQLNIFQYGPGEITYSLGKPIQGTGCPERIFVHTVSRKNTQMRLKQCDYQS